jgi:hypothetical protein
VSRLLQSGERVSVFFSRPGFRIPVFEHLRGGCWPPSLFAVIAQATFACAGPGAMINTRSAT